MCSVPGHLRTKASNLDDVAVQVLQEPQYKGRQGEALIYDVHRMSFFGKSPKEARRRIRAALEPGFYNCRQGKTETSQTLQKCRSTWTTQSRPCSQVALAPRWRTVAVSRGGRQVLFLLRVVFQCSLLRGMFSHGSPQSAAHPGSRPVLFPESGDPYVFLREVAFSVFSLCTHWRAGRASEFGWCAGSGTSHPTPTRCPSADVTSFWPLGRGEMAMSARVRCLLFRQSCDGLCKLPLCEVPLSCFSSPGCF